MFFWRTQQRQEVDLIDLIEESATGLAAYEVKWNAAKSNKAMSKTFLSAYPQVQCHGVSPQNLYSASYEGRREVNVLLCTILTLTFLKMRW